MPKHTRAEKIRADLRNQANPISYHFDPKTTPVLPHEQFKKVKTGLITDHSYIKGDLFRIIIFTLFAIGIQVGLFFILHPSHG